MSMRPNSSTTSYHLLNLLDVADVDGVAHRFRLKAEVPRYSVGVALLHSASLRALGEPPTPRPSCPQVTMATFL
jgi:hypothetical protein